MHLLFHPFLSYFQGGGFMETIKDVEKTVEDEFNKDVDLVKDATGMDTW